MSNNVCLKWIFLSGASILLVLIASFGNATERTAAKHHQVFISGFEFVPKVLKLSTGDTVTWVNKDVVPHNIIVGTKHIKLSPDLVRGEKFTFVAKASLSYECGFHPSMKGRLVIP